MDVLTPSNAHACILAACTDPCFHPGEHQRERLHVQVTTETKPPQKAAFGTWLAAGAEFVTVSRFQTHTLVYLPSQDTFYFASPATLLAGDCPDKTVLVGQFVIDDSKTPRILLFDVAKLHGVGMKDVAPRERYECLQKLQANFGPLCALQWAGDCDALAGELKAGRFVVPHPVKGVLALTGQPGRMVCHAS